MNAKLAAVVLFVAACAPAPQGSNTTAGLLPLQTSTVTSSPTPPSNKTMTFHAFSAAPLGQTDPVPLAKYKGQVLLIANTAAHCGYTPQYRPLGEVDRKYKARGFSVLAFVSDDFGHQAGTTEEVQACGIRYRATFEQFAEVHAKKGPQQHPLFAWLTTQQGFEGDVGWNFAKWLIGKDGQLLGRWDSDAAPDGPEISAAIEAALTR